MPTQDQLYDEWKGIAARWARTPYPPGRNDMPAALFDTYWSGGFADRIDLLRVALDDAYTSAEFPARSVEAEQWVEWFDEVRYTENGVAADRPAMVPTLWRAHVGDEAGISWTDDRERAQFFHNRNIDYFGFDGRLLQIENVHPTEVLARFHGAGSRNEGEWVLHPVVFDSATVVTQ